MTHRAWLMIGAVYGFLAVAFGAFGAHGLKKVLEANASLANYETGVRYLAYHALALLAVGWFARERPSRAAATAGWGFTLGAPLFTFSLIALSLVPALKLLGALVTPVGGLGLLVGWFALFLAAKELPDSAHAPKA